MKTSAFEQWCDRLQLSTATRTSLLLFVLLLLLVGSRAVSSMCGTFASRKMDVSIQFESHRDSFRISK